MKIRIIPTVLFNKSNCVKGKQFKSWRVCGNITQVIKLYSLRQVDEIIFIDISANKNPINFRLIDEFADECFMPITVGGGVKSLYDIEKLLKVGADRVCLNSSFFYKPEILDQAIKHFGSQCLVLSIDYKKILDKNYVFVDCGETNTKLDLEEYLKKAIDYNPGEIILTSIENDGMMNGYDHKTIYEVNEKFSQNFIISGGMSCSKDIAKIHEKTKIKAYSMSSIFHYTENTPLSIKEELKELGLEVRI